MVRSGYTLPVFAVAAAKAALQYALDAQSCPQVELNLLPDLVKIAIAQVARLDETSVLAITLSDPGDNLDLTRNTPIWAWVKFTPRQTEPLILQAGEGLGKTINQQPAIYRYARQLFESNLLPLIPPSQTIIVTIILPEGRELAKRTSNEAFGILEGLALLGTSGISQPLSAEEHLASLRAQLRQKLQTHAQIVLCIGNNGMQAAQRLGIPESAIAQTGNWIGAMLVEASLQGATSILLLGYQGKLLKLAGGIFNTSSHIADGKLEILTAATVRVGADLAVIQSVLQATTADQAYQILKDLQWADLVYDALATQVTQKAQAYIQKYANQPVQVGTILCDRRGQMISQDAPAQEFFANFRPT